MSATQRILCTFNLSHSRYLSTSFRASFLLRSSRSYLSLARSLSFASSVSVSRSVIVPYNQRGGGYRQQKFKQKPTSDMPSSSMEGASSSVADAVANKLNGLSIAENSGQSSVPSIGFGSIQVANEGPFQGQKAIWMPKSYGTVSGSTSAEVGNVPAEDTASAIQGNASQEATAQKSSMSLSKLFTGNLLENFTVDNSTYSLAEIRATFYPKFENEKSDQELRTFLICNGLSTLFKDGPAAYKAYYLRQMNIWGTSAGKQRQLSKMLDEWAVYIRRKYGNRQLSSSIYLSEAEPFLEQYARRSPENQALIGSAGNLVRSEEFLAIVERGRDEEGDLETDREVSPSSPRLSVKDAILKDQGLIVFFPGIPGCAKSALCKELLNAPGGLGDDRPVHSLMGDLVKGKYWQKVADERRRKPYSIMLADKNAPNEEVWRQIEDMCRSTRASAVPVVPDSEGTDSNPFSLDALAVFVFRVLQRVNHPGNLDKNSPNAGYVLLMFYHLYEGKSREEFEGELVERFGSLIKMPLLKDDRSPLPDHVRSVLEEGINLYKLHMNRHGRLESTKGSYAKEWAKWEKQLRETLFSNADYLHSVQVPFESGVKQVLEQLRLIAKGEYKAPSTEKRKFGTIVFAAVSLPVTQIQSLLENLAVKEPNIDLFFKDMKHNLKEAHITLAHKRSHGVTALASYGPYIHRNVPVELTALFFTDKMAALEAQLGSVDDEKIVSRNQWPHVTIWTGEGVAPKEANALPQLHTEGKATRIEINPPFSISGTLEFY